MTLVCGAGVLLSVALTGHTLGNARTPPQPMNPVIHVQSDVAEVLFVGFTPPAGVAGRVVQAIDGAREEVLVQAYGFTHNAIAQALIRAHRRGVKVEVLLDEKSESTNKYVLALFKEAGVTLRQDGAHAIAHNKVMVMDSEVVVTGSFNFTNAAETRNAENLLILRSQSLAQAYRDNWLSHWRHARP
ncbi:MAG: hypothetical protein RIT26_2266 [Pseudomonadota bacterium]